MFKHFGVVYDEKQVSKIVVGENYTVKLTRRVPRQRNALLRELYRDVVYGNSDTYPSYMYMFVDESHLSKKEMERRYGRSSKGKLAFVKSWGVPGEEDPTCCAIAALSIEGIMAVSIHKIVDGEAFLTSLENDIFPLMNPFPGVRSILVIDNASRPFKTTNDIRFVICVITTESS